jgi:triacylglycerol lipase
MTRCLLVLILSVGALGPVALAQTPEVRAGDVSVLGFKLHYREAGQGAPVVLLHGLGGSGAGWGATMAALAPSYHVIALDQIGFGDSDKPLIAYQNAVLAQFLVDFLHAMGLAKATLVGNSMGGTVAAYTAVHYPDAVDRLVIADGSGLARAPDAPKPDPRIAALQNGVTRAQTRDFLHILFHDPSFVTDARVEQFLAARLHAGFTIAKMQEATAAGVGRITDAEMSTITAPTLILWGQYDALAGPPEGLGARLHRDIAGSEFSVVENSGHLPQTEQPDAFNALVLKFLAEPLTH